MKPIHSKVDPFQILLIHGLGSLAKVCVLAGSPASTNQEHVDMACIPSSMEQIELLGHYLWVPSLCQALCRA